MIELDTTEEADGVSYLILVLLGWVAVSVPASFALAAIMGKLPDAVHPAHRARQRSPRERVESPLTRAR
jgi:hypothetical protein